MFGLLETCKLLVVTVVIYLLLSGCQEIFYRYEREASAVTCDQTSVHLWPFHQVLWSAFHLVWNGVHHCDSTWWRCRPAVTLAPWTYSWLLSAENAGRYSGASHFWSLRWWLCVCPLQSCVPAASRSLSVAQMSPVLQWQQVPAGPKHYLFTSTEDLIRAALNQSFLIRASSAQLGSDRWESLSLWVQCGSLQSNLQF